METLLTNVPEVAAEIIRRGGVVAFPTETVYGLGANVFDAAAVARIFEAKQRPANNPLIAHVASMEQIEELAAEITPSAREFIKAFFPGPLTVVLRKTERVPAIATAGLNTIGIRMPRFAPAHRFIEACGVPVAAPSANVSGRPSPTTWQAVFEDLNGRIDGILQGELTEIGLESTVVDCMGEFPVVLRSGSVSVEQLQAVVPGTAAATGSDTEAPRSPGMLYRHYSPRARVVIGLGGADGGRAAFIGLNEPETSYELTKICVTAEEYARSLFEFFREADRAGVDTIYCEAVPETGIGAAIMDRLRRAAEV